MRHVVKKWSLEACCPNTFLHRKRTYRTFVPRWGKNICLYGSRNITGMYGKGEQYRHGGGCSGSNIGIFTEAEE